MQYMASGFGWAERRLRFDYHALIGWGVIAAGITGAAAWLAGRPFLTSDYGYVKLPFLEEFELATARGFDLGVFLTVRSEERGVGRAGVITFRSRGSTYY